MSITQRWMARYYDRAMVNYEQHAHERRRALLDLIPKGARVLELGPGTGINLQHLAQSGRTDIHWRGVEPNPHMRKRMLAGLADKPSKLDQFEFVGLSQNGTIEAEDQSADIVLSTLVLCSVPNPDQTLAEVYRLLPAGGKFLFMEHVGAKPGTATRRFQSIVTPIWRRIADGCCLDRDTESTIQDAGFEHIEAESFQVHKKGAPFFVRPHLAGSAIK